MFYSAGDPTEGCLPAGPSRLATMWRLASGRPLRTYAQATAMAEVPPISSRGVVFGGRPDRGDVSPSGSSRLATMWWLTDWRQADHYVTSRMRSSRLFPRRVLHSAGDPTEGRNRNNVRSGAHTLLSSPDLCKSGAERAENLRNFNFLPLVCGDCRIVWN